MPILDTMNPSANNDYLFLGENEYGQRFYRRESNVYAFNTRGESRWYCTWTSWLTIGHKVAGIELKQDKGQ